MLQACLNGSRPTDAHPALPVLARHLARDARAVAQHGVSSVHIHPRCPGGLESIDPAHVGEAVASIREEVANMEVGVPAARWVQPDVRDRVEAVLAWGRLGNGRPDVVAVNVHDQGWREVCAAARAAGMQVELGVWTSGDVVELRKAGIPDGIRRVIAESTVPCQDAAVAEAIRIVRALGKLPVPLLLHGEEGGAWAVLEYALRMGIDARIGFEDVLVKPDNWLATGNEDLVEYAIGLLARSASSP